MSLPLNNLTTNLGSHTDRTPLRPVPDEERRSNAYRFQGIRAFLTYAQCPLAKEKAIELLEAKLKNVAEITGYVISEEKHENGDPHLHCMLKFNKALRTRDVRWADLTGEDYNYHPNIESVKHARKCIEYIIKDKNYIDNGDVCVEDILKRKKKMCSQVAQLIDNGEDLEAVRALDSGYFLANLAKVKDYHAYVSSIDNSTKLRWYTLDLEAYRNPQTRDIAEWLNMNLLKERNFKQRQLYIHGKPSLGKTSMCEELEKYFRIYYMPREDWYDDYDDTKYDLIVMDEFKGQRTVQFLNQFLQGSKMPLKRKGISGVLKRKNLPVIILSNYSPEQVYRNVDSMCIKALETRLEVIEVTRFITLDVAHNHVTPPQSPRVLVPETPPESEDEASPPSGLEIDEEEAREIRDQSLDFISRVQPKEGWTPDELRQAIDDAPLSDYIGEKRKRSQFIIDEASYDGDEEDEEDNSDFGSLEDFIDDSPLASKYQEAAAQHFNDFYQRNRSGKEEEEQDDEIVQVLNRRTRLVQKRKKKEKQRKKKAKLFK